MKILQPLEKNQSSGSIYLEQLVGSQNRNGRRIHREEDNVLCSFRFLALLALTFVVIFSLAIGIAFIYTVTSQDADLELVSSEAGGFWNDRPIIGILAQEYHNDGEVKVNEPSLSYIAASYVKFVEGGGGRVVPVKINQTRGYYDEIFQGINGLLLPGGGVYFNESGYASAAKYLMTLAREANDNGDHFPVWGTCLGFEYLIYEVLGTEVLANCNSYNISTTLQFTQLATNSELFKRAPATVLKLLANQPLASNFHHFCVTKDTLKQHSAIEEQYNVLSWSNDSLEPLFVSSIESKKYPFFGIQFHPEKNMYEWSWKKNIPHTSEAVLIGQYFAQFLINQARKSRHTFGSYEDESQHLIYNYNVTYSGGVSGGGIFEQNYFFPLSE